MASDPVRRHSRRKKLVRRRSSRDQKWVLFPQRLDRLRRDSLIANTFFLATNSAATAGFGFLFWLIAAHLFPASDVGLATTLITAAGLISAVAQCGLNSSFVAFLPASSAPSDVMNGGLRLCLGVSVFVAIAYIAASPQLVKELALLYRPGIALAFVMLSAMMAINSLTDSVFVAYRRAHYNVLIDGVIQGVAKVVLLLALVTAGGIGIFVSFGLGATVAVGASLVLMVRLFGYVPAFRGYRLAHSGIVRYSVLSYMANVVNFVPNFVLPLLIVSQVGTSAAAFFYVPLQIAGLLYGAAAALSLSVFAEGSQPKADLTSLTRRAILTDIAFLAPGIAIIILLSSRFLSIFGAQYEQHSRVVLIVLTLGAAPVALNTLTSGLLRIRFQLGALLVTNVLFAVTGTLLAALWVHRSLWWLALALFIGEAVSGLAGLLALITTSTSEITGGSEGT